MGILLSLAGGAALALPMVFGFVNANLVCAQAAAPAANEAQNIADTWQGTLHAGRDLRIVAKISKADGGGYKGDFYSIDQGGDADSSGQDYAGWDGGEVLDHGDRRDL